MWALVHAHNVFQLINIPPDLSEVKHLPVYYMFHLRQKPGIRVLTNMLSEK